MPGLFLGVLGPRCCARAFSGCAGSSLLCLAFSSWSEQGLLSVAVCGLCIAMASLVAAHGL